MSSFLADERTPNNIEVLSTREQLDKMHITNEFRDQCVDFLVVLQRCRAEFGTNPFNCNHERHTYEHCEYDLFKANKNGQSPPDHGHH